LRKQKKALAVDRLDALSLYRCTAVVFEVQIKKEKLQTRIWSQVNEEKIYRGEVF